MPNCKVGDLCVVTMGPNAGRSCTIVGKSSPLEAAVVFHKAAGLSGPAAKVHPKLVGTTMWLLDTPMIWKTANKKHDAKIPYMPDNMLMPITPPASMTSKTTDKELTA